MSDSDILKRILIFDDDADLRRLLLTYLGKMFAGVELEQYDPLERGAPPDDFDWSRYDVLILDNYLCLHGVTGLDILQTNRKKPAFPATIMLTGAGNEEVAMRALKAGVYDYLRKQSLDKEELRSSILNAFEKHKREKKRALEQTQQGAAFNKALFYQQLEYKKGDPQFRNRVLFLIQLDDHAAIEERAGIILRDNIIRHIARQAYEVFKLGKCDPTVSRHGDYSIALLINSPESRKTLEFNLTGLINHLEKRPYKFGDKQFRFTVRVGAVVLPGNGESADTILQYARAACEAAALAADHSYYIHAGETNPVPIPVKPDKQPAIPEQSHPAPIIPDPQPPQENADLIQVPDSHSEHSATNPITQAPGLTIDLEPQQEPVAKIIPSAPVTRPADVKSGARPMQPPAPGSRPAVKPATVSVQKPAPPPSPVTARPLKSVAELKAEAARPKPVQTSTPIPKTDAELDLTQLDESGRNLKIAFDEKRVIQVFQPVISLLNEEMDSDDEIHKVSLQLIDKGGSVRTAADIKSSITDPAFKKFVDRWLLREIIGRLSNSSKNKYTFILDISDASLADAGFFNWLRKLLTGLDARNPGKFIVMEIDIKHLTSLEKQANALMTYLRKTHDFKFLLGNIDTTAELVQFTGSIRFDLIRCKQALIKELEGMPPSATSQATDPKNTGNSQLEMIKSAGSRFIADDIEDATALTEVITLGAEYAMGKFIGEPATQLDDVTNIETFEIV